MCKKGVVFCLGALSFDESRKSLETWNLVPDILATLSLLHQYIRPGERKVDGSYDDGMRYSPIVQFVPLHMSISWPRACLTSGATDWRASTHPPNGKGTIIFGVSRRLCLGPITNAFALLQQPCSARRGPRQNCSRSI